MGIGLRETGRALVKMTAAPREFLRPVGRQAFSELAEGRVMGELEGWAGEMLLQLRGYWFWILGELGESGRKRERARLQVLVLRRHLGHTSFSFHAVTG